MVFRPKCLCSYSQASKDGEVFVNKGYSIIKSTWRGEEGDVRYFKDRLPTQFDFSSSPVLQYFSCEAMV